MPAEYEERILFHFPAGSARSQTSDIPQRYIKAIPREGEFAFDREPSPAASRRSRASGMCSGNLKLYPESEAYLQFKRSPTGSASPERRNMQRIFHILPRKESTILSLRAIPRRRSRAKPSTHRSPGQKSAKNLDFSRMG